MTPAPDDRIDRLYTLPLNEFTPARNALVVELHGEGDPDGAAAVKALRKPSRSAWVVNQIVRARPDLVESLLGAGGELRQAHRQAASGRGAAQLRAAAEAERAAIERLVSSAEEAVGVRPAPALTESIRNTLHAASSDDRARELVASGRLVEELRPVGLGPVPAGKAPISRSAKARSAKGPGRDTERIERERRLADAHAEERALGRELEAAQRAADRAEQSLARAREAAEAATERAADARKRLRTARAGLREAAKARERLERLQDR